MSLSTIHIELNACTGCGACLALCPSGILIREAGRVAAREAPCLECGQCQAACPEGAITVQASKNATLQLATVTTTDQWLPYGQPEPALLVRLLRSRQSCRAFRSAPLPRLLLDDLVALATTAPSGTNSQEWRFVVLPDRQSVVEAGERIAAFFSRLNRLAARAWLRQLLKLCGRPALAAYHDRHFHSTRAALADWRQHGRDRLFHGAPALILIGSSARASCPAEDALLATQNLLLAAHSLGVGSCLIGFAVEAIRREPELRNWLGLGRDETIYSAIALGYPAVAYHGLTGRRKPRIRYVQV